MEQGKQFGGEGTETSGGDDPGEQACARACTNQPIQSEIDSAQ